MPRKPGHLQCEPAVAAAQVDGAHPGFDAYIREHFGGLCPQRLPPACIWHSGAFKETGQGHDEIASMFTRRDDLVRLSRPTASYKGIETIWSGCPLTNEGGNEPVTLLRSTITCPVCGHRETETMRTDACQFFYECMKCKTLLRPKAGDCCVFCSYGDVPCPPIQKARASGRGVSCCGDKQTRQAKTGLLVGPSEGVS